MDVSNEPISSLSQAAKVIKTGAHRSGVNLQKEDVGLSIIVRVCKPYNPIEIKETKFFSTVYPEELWDTLLNYFEKNGTEF